MNKNKINILVVGTGSIGIRHIENFLKLKTNVSAFSYRKNRAKFLSEKYGIKVFNSIKEALNSNQNAVIICNRTDQHLNTAFEAVSKGLNVFIEKPLSNKLSGINKLKSIIKKKSLIVEIGCMMRFNPCLKFIKKKIKNNSLGKIFIVRAWAGQYLPDWRPDQDYSKSYSAKKEYGGGVLFDIIHEIDYLYWLFGKVSEISSFLDNVSDLKINTEDVAQILLRFDNGMVAQLELDYLSPFYRRGCEIIGEKGSINWDYVTGKVTCMIKGNKKQIFNQSESFERNNMFTDHAKYFLRNIKNKNINNNAVSLDDGINVLKIALAAQKSSKEKKVISPESIK